MSELLTWFRETEDLWTRIFEHVRLSFFPVVAAIALALPIGLYIGHSRRFEFFTITTANLGRSIPSFAIVALALPLSIQFGLGLGFWPTFAALFLLSIPPILTNTYVGVKSVDPDVVESARGVGFSERQILRRVELPLSASLIVAGIRTAAVQTVATATLGALVAGGGLGEYIRLGFRSGRDGPLIGGGLLVAGMALITELGLGLVEKKLRPASGGPPREKAWEEVGQAPRPPVMDPV